MVWLTALAAQIAKKKRKTQGRETFPCTIVKNRGWRPNTDFFFAQNAELSRKRHFFQQRSLCVRSPLEGWFSGRGGGGGRGGGCSCAPCKRFSRSVVALLMQWEKDQSLKKWEKTLQEDRQWPCPASEKCAWSSIEKLRKYGPQQYTYWPHPLRSDCFSAANQVGLQTGSLWNRREVLNNQKSFQHCRDMHGIFLEQSRNRSLNEKWNQASKARLA